MAVILAIIATTSCSSENEGAVMPAVGDSNVSAPLALRVLDESTISDAAAVDGIVRIVGGCLALEHEGALLTIVWYGNGMTVWDPELERVTMDRGNLEALTATVGEEAFLGGTITEGDWADIDWIGWEVKPGVDCPRKLLVI